MDMSNYESRMDKTISVLQENFSEVRAGRANPAILNKVKVDYYGVSTPINQVAGISVPEGRMLLVSPWDSTLVKPIKKAIEDADLGVNPSDDGKVIGSVLPMLTEERRRDLLKQINKMTENQKVVCRNFRRDVLDECKKLKKDSQITEDDLKYAETEVQKILDGVIDQIDKLANEKEKEIMEI